MANVSNGQQPPEIGLKWPVIKFYDQLDNQLKNITNCYYEYRVNV